MSGCRNLTDIEIQDIKKTLKRQRDKTLFILGIRTGLRISELLSIKIGDVYRFNKVVPAIKLARHQIKGKKLSRTIVLHPDAINEIERLLGTLDDLSIDAPLFKSSHTKNAISRIQAHRLLKDVTRYLQLDGKVAWHSTRKSLAWNFYNRSGHDLISTQKALGHSCIKSTIQYLDPDQKEVDALIVLL